MHCARFIVGDQCTVTGIPATSRSRTTYAPRKNERADRLRYVDRRIRSRINTFESWLQTGTHKDSRAIEDIPPAELDKYLADFFLTVKTLSGEEFSYNSLCALRGSLERYLKDQEYPYSITTSHMFKESRAAWLKKLEVCKVNERLKLKSRNTEKLQVLD